MGVSTEIKLVDSSDLKIYSDGSTVFYLGNDQRFRNKASDENFLTFLANDAVTMFFDGSKKFETTSTGATVTGDLILTGTGTATSNALDIQYNHTSGLAQINADSSGGSTSLSFGTSNSGTLATAMTINSSGRVGIGTTIPDHLLHVKGSSAVLKIDHTGSGDTTGVVMRHGRGGLSGFNGKMISFIGNDSTEEGSIVIHTTTTAYNTSSDYRLKENEVAISDAITRLRQLKPYTFNFKKDPDVKVDGFFAHEVSSVVPIAVTGEKDAVNDDGSIKPQGIDQSKLVPLLVAAVQELTAKVEALEAA